MIQQCLGRTQARAVERCDLYHLISLEQFLVFHTCTNLFSPIHIGPMTDGLRSIAETK